MIEIKKISDNKKQFLNLLLLADEEEAMIDRYLYQGEMFALYNGDLKGVCVITKEDEQTCELKNLAIYEEYQQQGYGRRLIEYICDYYKNKYTKMLVGTGESPNTLRFYEHCGFERSHRVKNFFTDNYSVPIIDCGVQLSDMVYLKRDLV